MTRDEPDLDDAKCPDCGFTGADFLQGDLTGDVDAPETIQYEAPVRCVNCGFIYPMPPAEA